MKSEGRDYEETIAALDAAAREAIVPVLKPKRAGRVRPVKVAHVAEDGTWVDTGKVAGHDALVATLTAQQGLLLEVRPGEKATHRQCACGAVFARHGNYAFCDACRTARVTCACGGKKAFQTRVCPKCSMWGKRSRVSTCRVCGQSFTPVATKRERAATCGDLECTRKRARERATRQAETRNHNLRALPPADVLRSRLAYETMESVAVSLGVDRHTLRRRLGPPTLEERRAQAAKRWATRRARAAAKATEST